MPTLTISWPPDRGYFYCLTIVSLLAAKFLHLFSHLPALPIFLFLLYFPTFIFQDVLVILISRVIFQKSLIVSSLLCFVITVASAAQIGFFIETGGEIRWHMMAKVLREPDGFFGMLMTGFAGVAATTGVLGGIAWLVNPALYSVTCRMVKALAAIVCCNSSSSSQCLENSSGSYTVLRDDEQVSVDAMDYDEGEDEKREILAARSRRWARLKLLIALAIIVVLHVVRPKSPYTHMSGTLPFTLFEGIFTNRSPFCDPAPWDGPARFPLPEQIKPDFWIPPAGEDGGIGRGWTPGIPWWEVERKKPDWLPKKPTAGFEKWYRRRRHHGPPHGHHPPPPPPPPAFERRYGHHPEGHPPPPPPPGAPPPPSPPGYESVLDPLKITNLDQPLLQELQNALKDRKIPIKHVVLMSLESTRKDVFPLDKNGALYKQLSQSRFDSQDIQERSEDELADLTELSRNAEEVTGQDAHFGRWKNSTHGGINTVNALTGSTFTLKSLLGSHCGVTPLPVDFLEELESEIYQACLPHILSVMNAQHENPAKENGWAWTNHTWKSVFMQASTNKFDRQQPALKQMGFKQTVVREDLQSPNAAHPPKGPELNYFGYSEAELKPYMRDLFDEAEKNGERVFLSHLTSSTHHPWATPDEFGQQQRYWGGSKGGGTPWDRYLNSIKWGDRWIGEVLDLLKDVGVADETLVVMVGDHGFSFGDDSASKTTYANAHINSFRVPLVFHHPLLPHLQLNVTTTSMAILPTILDLLVTTSSLSPLSSTIASDLLPEYEGQSLARTFLPTRDGRQQWNFGVVNPGGTHLSIVSSAHPYRLVLPICEPSPYQFSDLNRDPDEKQMVEDWEAGSKMWLKVKTRYGDEAAAWVETAEKIGAWWVWEARRRWGYWGGTRREDRGAGHNDDGLLEHDHWWET